MYTILYICKATILVLISAIELAMLARAILSWFPIDEDNGFLRFLMMITEPVIYPVRALFERMNWFQDFPLDMAFFFAFVLLSILRMFL